MQTRGFAYTTYTLVAVAILALLAGLTGWAQSANAAPKDIRPTITVNTPVAGQPTKVVVTVQSGKIKKVNLRIDNQPVTQKWKIKGQKATTTIIWPASGYNLVSVGVTNKSGKVASAVVGVNSTEAVPPGPAPTTPTPTTPTPSPSATPTPKPSEQAKSCPSGTTDLGNGYCRSSQGATKSTSTYAAKGTSGTCWADICHAWNTCSNAACGVTQTCSAYSYSCPSGGNLQGSTCVPGCGPSGCVGFSYPATQSCSAYTTTNNTCATSACGCANFQPAGCNPTTYSCPSGGTLSGTTCTVVGDYTCPSGWSLSGSTCTKDVPKS